MDKELFTTLGEALKQIGALSAIALPFGLGYSIWRTSSFLLIRRRLWLILYGKEEITDKATREAIAEQSSLMAFRWTFGLQTRTLKQAQTARRAPERRSPRQVAHSCYRAVCSVVRFARTQSDDARVLPSQCHQALVLGKRFRCPGGRPAFPEHIFPVHRKAPPHTADDHGDMCKANKFPSDTFGLSQSNVLCEFLTQPDIEANICSRQCATGELHSGASALAGCTAGIPSARSNR